MANTTSMPVNPICKPDCITEVRVGNTVLIVKGYLNANAIETAIDKMARVLRAEIDNQPSDVA